MSNSGIQKRTSNPYYLWGEDESACGCRSFRTFERFNLKTFVCKEDFYLLCTKRIQTLPSIVMDQALAEDCGTHFVYIVLCV